MFIDKDWLVFILTKTFGLIRIFILKSQNTESKMIFLLQDHLERKAFKAFMARQEKADESTRHVQAAHPTKTQWFVFSTALAANQRPQTRGRWGENGPACLMVPPTLSLPRHHPSGTACFQSLSLYSPGFTLFLHAGDTLPLSVLYFFLCSKWQTAEYHLSERLVVKLAQAWASHLMPSRAAVVRGHATSKEGNRQRPRQCKHTPTPILSRVYYIHRERKRERDNSSALT